MSRWITTILALTLLTGSAFAQAHEVRKATCWRALMTASQERGGQMEGGDQEDSGGQMEGGHVGNGRSLTGRSSTNTDSLAMERETHA